MMATAKRIKCGGCNKPILLNDLGGVGRAVNGAEVWFHNAITCILAVSAVTIPEHAQELTRIGKELKHGRPATSKKLSEPPFNPDSDF